MAEVKYITERRSKPRVETKVRVKVLGDGGFPEVYTGNLSKNGVFLDTRHAFAEVGEKIQMQIMLDNASEAVRVLGRVARVSGPNKIGQAAGMGIEFLKVETRQARTFDRLIDRLLDAKGIGSRKFPRVRMQVAIEFKRREEVREAIADNLSKGGLFLRIPVDDLSLGDPIQVVMLHPTAKRRFLVEGRVVHIRKGDSEVRPDFAEGVGIQFVDLSAARQSDMSLFLRSMLSAKKRSPKK